MGFKYDPDMRVEPVLYERNCDGLARRLWSVA